MAKDEARRLKELEAAQVAYITEIGRLQAQLGELSGEVGRLQGELLGRRGVRPAMHALYKAVDKAITRRVELRGYTRKPSRRAITTPIQQEALQSDDLAVLLAAAENYDATTYFRVRSSKTGMRLQYRVASAIYTGARDLGVGAARAAYRMLLKRGSK